MSERNLLSKFESCFIKWWHFPMMNRLIFQVLFEDFPAWNSRGERSALRIARRRWELFAIREPQVENLNHIKKHSFFLLSDLNFIIPIISGTEVCPGKFRTVVLILVFFCLLETHMLWSTESNCLVLIETKIWSLRLPSWEFLKRLTVTCRLQFRKLKCNELVHYSHCRGGLTE